MANETEAVPYLENVGFFLTYKCEIACSHCSVKAGPHRTEVVDEREAFDWIAQIAAYGDRRIKAVNFTGGEPFFDLPALRRLVRFTASKGLFATSVTNAYWAVTPRAAVETLRSLPELLSLQISADEHHQERIPFERVRNAILAARELGLVYAVAVCTEDESSPGYRRILDQLVGIAEPARVRTFLTLPMGRALVRLGGPDGDLPLREVPRIPCGGADTPYVFPDGRVLTCVGALDLEGDHPLVLGRLREEPIAQILDEAEMNLALHFLRVWGPARLSEALRFAGLERGSTAHHPLNDPCSLCRCLMSHPSIRCAVGKLAEDEELLEKLAYARLHYFDEDGMVRRLGLA